MITYLDSIELSTHATVCCVLRAQKDWLLFSSISSDQISSGILLFVWIWITWALDHSQYWLCWWNSSLSSWSHHTSWWCLIRLWSNRASWWVKTITAQSTRCRSSWISSVLATVSTLNAISRCSSLLLLLSDHGSWVTIILW